MDKVRMVEIGQADYQFFKMLGISDIGMYLLGEAMRKHAKKYENGKAYMAGFDSMIMRSQIPPRPPDRPSPPKLSIYSNEECEIT